MWFAIGFMVVGLCLFALAEYKSHQWKRETVQMNRDILWMEALTPGQWEDTKDVTVKEVTKGSLNLAYQLGYAQALNDIKEQKPTQYDYVRDQKVISKNAANLHAEASQWKKENPDLFNQTKEELGLSDVNIN